MDPVSAMATASAAFGALKKGFSIGRDIESMAGDLSRWMGALSDIDQAEKEAKNPPIFKKLFNGKSVEQEAMEIYAKEKKMLQQEKDLRQLLLYTYGQGGYQELVDLRRKIKEQREKTVYAQARRRKAFIWNTSAIVALAVMSYAIYELTFLIIRSMP